MTNMSTIKAKHMMVSFSNPHPSQFGWIIPNDTLYSYRFVALRENDTQTLTIQSHGTAEEDFKNSVATLPREERLMEATAHLFWCDDTVSEMWLFTFMHNSHFSQIESEITQEYGIEVRTPAFFPYFYSGGPPLRWLRFVSRDALLRFLRMRPVVGLECTWLAFSSVPTNVFPLARLCEGADCFLFKTLPRGSNLPQVFPNADSVQSSWRYTIKQDAWHHESGDPLFCIPITFTASFEAILEIFAKQHNYQRYQTRLSEPIYLNFIKSGEIMLSPP